MGNTGWSKAILVTEPNHIKQASVIARDGGLTFVVSPVTDSPGWNNPDVRMQNLLGDARALMIYQFHQWQLWSP
jgi:uncharacterized SAM-binding protein YcdF (DUF218 family)